MYQSTRQASARQEKAIAKSLNAKRTINSGADKFSKGDLFIDNEWLIEAKTSMTPKNSFSVKKQWLEKMLQEQYGTNKLYSSLCFDFGDEGKRYYVIDENTFKLFIELLQNSNT